MIDDFLPEKIIIVSAECSMNDGEILFQQCYAWCVKVIRTRSSNGVNFADAKFM